ncbi:MAG: hypothetical protein JXM73_14570 [Anaerolineae bacterium]|nr:hypothetical protein [Anaerolineae bacterium]
METHLYLSLIPEALIASQLDPDGFGVYYACGSAQKSRSEALFFEIDPTFRHPYFDVESGYRRLTPHEDGSPKQSVYISIYRVLEHVPLSAIQRLYVTTQDGRTLGLDGTKTLPELSEKLYLYQEIAPVHPRAVSTFGPRAFFELLCNPAGSMVNLPALCFADLDLGGLAADPEFGSSQGLPYSNIEHYRECLIEVSTKANGIKIVDRSHPAAFSLRTIKSGFYLGSGCDLMCFPMPSEQVLRAEYYKWWRSAQM